jgi:multidrug resistance efflux pump
MKKITILLALTGYLSATSYMGQIQAYKDVEVKSEVTGKVVYVNEAKAFSNITDKTLLIKLDTQNEEIQLNTLRENYALSKEIVEISNLSYTNKAKVPQISIYEKNQEKMAVLNAKLSLANLKQQIKTAKLSHERKHFFIENYYVDEILVQTGDYVTMGQTVFRYYDLSKRRLEVYVKADEITMVKDAKVLVNGQTSSFKVEHISQVRDLKKISTFKVTLASTTDATTLGSVVSVEFKR